jgi:predicted Zn-dependent peptidase
LSLLGSVKDSPVTRFRLANGLQVVVQPDQRVPIVTAVVIYNVGARDERLGQFGYAHLFEHLMIGGSEHWNQVSSRSLRDLGATGSNATTTEDRTIFYETVPRVGLERTLFLEADRMGFLAAALTAEQVAREVDVVLNEKRQRGDAPYGQDWATIFGDLYPSDHPYRHSVIGNEADLRAITVEQARQWFRNFYGPTNATLILTGDVSVEDARALATRYFGGLAPHAPADRVLTQYAPLSGPVRRRTFRAVPASRVYVTYRAPPAGSPEIADLDLIAQIMGNGTASRLSRRLVSELGIATVAMVTFNEKQLSSEMGFVADGVSPDQTVRVESEIDAALARFIAEGPTPEELESARTARIRYVRRSQTTTFGKAFLLMRSALVPDDPDYAATYLRQLSDATPERLRRTAAAVYGEPAHHLTASPVAALKQTTGGYDLAKGPPPIGPVQTIAFPAIEQARLSNGLEVVLVPRRPAMTASLLLRIGSGSASAPRPIPAFAIGLLTGAAGAPADGTPTARAEALGGQLKTEIRPDYADLALSVDMANMAKGIALLGELTTKSRISSDALTSLRQRRVAALRGERTNASTIAQRLVSYGVYGATHPYGQRRSAAEDVGAVEAVDVAAIEAWTRGHIRPDNATLYVAADTDMGRLRPMLESALHDWMGKGPAAQAIAIAPAATNLSPSLTVVDMPGARQSMVVAGRTLPPGTAIDDIALHAANEVYGGNDTSRIGTNLRQQKGWTYGIGSGAQDARGPRLWQIAGSVSSEHSGDAVAELIAELRALGRDRPPEQEELDRIVNTSVNRVATRLEGDGDLLRAMADAHSYGRPLDSIVRDPTHYRTLTLGDLRAAAQTVADPSKLHWVIVGDWQRIQSQFKDLSLGVPIILRPGAD